METSSDGSGDALMVPEMAGRMDTGMVEDAACEGEFSEICEGGAAGTVGTVVGAAGEGHEAGESHRDSHKAGEGGKVDISAGGS